jgi:hypothetical protein
MVAGKGWGVNLRSGPSSTSSRLAGDGHGSTVDDFVTPRLR